MKRMMMGLAGAAMAIAAEGAGMALGDGARVVSVRGLVGRRLEEMRSHDLAKVDWAYLDFPFTQKTETGSWSVLAPGIWQTEFWGKYMHAAVPLALYAGDEALKARIGESVKRVLATQQADGYIGNYRPENRGTVCDVWGAKYVMMGLLHWFDATGDKAALDGASRLADWLMSVAGPGRMSLGATGPFGGLMNCSVLEPVVWIYRRIRLRQDFGGQARARKYLEYAKWIVSELDTNAKGPELIPLALKGVPVRERHPERDGHKAYEMMSCCQGLLDYYEETGDRRVLEAVVRSAENIVADEIDICGGGTRGERFAGTAKAQTTDGFRGSETCVLITWMRLCEKLCEVTGEPRWADELERTFFNAYLGQLAVDGSTFASYEGLAGVRERRHPLQCRMEANCCSANGPRGFLSFLGSAASAKSDVITVNQYVFGHVDVPCAAVGGGNVRLDSFTEYPRVMRYAVTLALQGPAEFTLRFRAPAWSAKTAVRTSSGEMAESKGGEYISLRRIWKPGDQIEVTFDDRVVPHRLNGCVAFTRGPLALARDIRFADGDLAEVVRGEELRFEEKLPPDASMYMSVGGRISLCDYASAGNTKDGKSAYRVWLPENGRELVAPRIDCEFCSQDDLDAAVETLEMCYLREPKFGLVRPFFKPGACPSGVNDYGGKWWSLDYALAVEGAKWLDFGIGEDLVTNLCAVICPDGRMKLYSADWKKCVDGKDAYASSLPKFHETVYAVARMSARREVREQALSLLERNLAWWFRERQDPETKLVTAMFEETFVPNTDSGPGVYAPLDTNLEIAIGAQNAAALAELLGRSEKAKAFRVKADEILAAVARYCHEPADGRFRPYLVREKRRVPTDLASMFLAFRLPGFGRDARLLSALRGEEFGWDAVPLCSASRKDPRFNAHDGDYRGNPSWLGGVWTLHNDAVIRALRAGGDDETATALALKTVQAFRGKSAEFLNPDTGRGNGMLRYAWTASQFIRIVLEELFGLSYTAEGGLVCRPAFGFTGSLHGLRIPGGRVADIDVRQGVAEVRK